MGDVAPITLNGSDGSTTFTDQTVYAYIIGFDHNPSLEGNNSIHFQFGKNADGDNIVFTSEQHYDHGNTYTIYPYTMNSESTGTSDGWKGSRMRNTYCSRFLTCLPEEWQDIITPCNKYTNNKGYNATEGDVTPTKDKIWLLSEFEVYGLCTGAYSVEQNYQQQYAYYANGNSKIKYKENDPATPCIWWLRSVYDKSYCFCQVNAKGEIGYSRPEYSYGFAPGFMVA